MDSFFASVEVLDDPSLVGRPVIVGGAGARGVVASCTYEARAFGIHSAMSSVEARRRCPHAVFLPGRFARYVEMSERLHAVLRRFSPVVEGIALDEAFVDVAGARRLLGPPPEVARRDPRGRARRTWRWNAAVGVARTKLLAKLASRAAKPVLTPDGPRPGPGVVVVLPAQELAFLHPLPVRALWGVGPATGPAARASGSRPSAIWPASPRTRCAGRSASPTGTSWPQLARGEDPRPVVANREVKSVGHEETFAVDIDSHDGLHRHVVRMADAVGTRLREARLAGRTITVKVRFGDRATITRSHTVGGAARLPPGPRGRWPAPCSTPWTCRPGSASWGCRCRGSPTPTPRPASSPSTTTTVGPADARTTRAGAGPGPTPAGPRGRSPAPPARQLAWHEVEAAVSAIRARYGNASVGPAALVGRDGLAVKERGDTQWGPSAPPAADRCRPMSSHGGVARMRRDGAWQPDFRLRTRE